MDSATFNEFEFENEFENELENELGKMINENEFENEFELEIELDENVDFSTPKEYCSYIDGKKDGPGMMSFGKDDYYIGDFKNDLRSGVGRRQYSLNNEHKTSHYNGYWENNEINGHGTYYYFYKQIYMGNWLNGKKHGQGWYQFASGNIYNGEFADDYPTGNGNFYTSGYNHIYTGKLDFTKRVNGEIEYVDKSKSTDNIFAIYKGEVRCILKGISESPSTREIYDPLEIIIVEDGHGQLTIDGKTYIGHWENGVKIGEFIVIELISAQNTNSILTRETF